jgi:putative glycosyltransferase (TIGR04372 family)
MKFISHLKSYPSLIFTIPLSLIPLFFIIIISPIIRIKVYLIRSHRIGHFAADLELHICEKKELKSKEVSIHYFARPVCNFQLAKMWKRKLIIFPAFVLRPLDFLIRAFPLLKGFSGTTLNLDRDVLNLYDKYPTQICFTSDEEKFGKKELFKLGVPPGKPFVCLIVRDSRYLDPMQIGVSDIKNNYRNSNIENYYLAAENLAKMGYYVLRMGANVNKPFTSLNPMIIDYATNGSRTDFMDVYLGANCEFCISTGTGFDALPMIFRRPIVFVNYTPIEYFLTSRKELISIPRHHFSFNLNRRLSFSEILKNGFGTFLDASLFEKFGIELVENSPEEISDVVVEMAKRVKGTWISNSKDDKLQDKFWFIFKRDSHFFHKDDFGNQQHGDIKGKIGANFLRSNQELLD